MITQRSPVLAPVQKTSNPPLPRPLLQRKCACGGAPGPTGECEGCRKKRLSLQRTARNPELGTLNAAAVPPIVYEVLRSPGQPLDHATRAFMEPRFGHDFGKVRVHTDARAAESAHAVSAAAYTVGQKLVFDSARYVPGTAAGRRLIAHELTHVIQQGERATEANLKVSSPGDQHERDAESAAAAVVNGGTAAVRSAEGNPPTLDRDLATPHPKEKPPAQPALTDAEIQAAIKFNSSRYDDANTKRIQDLAGASSTGTWDAGTIRLIALLQEEYGLKKDGRVDLETFNFLQHEQQLEGSPTTAERCLTGFGVTEFPTQQTVTPGPGGTVRLMGHHQVNAEFSARCGCDKYQYRQFIQGTAVGMRGTASQNLASLFSFVPGGQLPATFQEDGNTAWTAPNYGHRDQPGQATTDATNAENHYVNDADATDQTNGCRYRGEDYPKITVQNLMTGDVVRVLVEFRGEIQRDGVPVQTKRWKDIDANVTIP